MTNTETLYTSNNNTTNYGKMIYDLKTTKIIAVLNFTTSKQSNNKAK